MSVLPGTTAYYDQLAADLAAAKARAGVALPTRPLTLHSSFEDIRSVFKEIEAYEAWARTAEAHQLQQRIDTHAAALEANRQRAINERQAAKIQAASCSSCFMPHAPGQTGCE
ncbi:hypothetical protein [Nonomuraea sp. NPDC052265]|uniref:hypothetical protein n=1 Tax=Nonomuraea sp. NPDC052265 TaxID=3364374 RepID=UPI0037C5F839